VIRAQFGELKLPKLLLALFEAQASATSGDWVLAAAGALIGEAPKPGPKRWFEKLRLSFSDAVAYRIESCRDALVQALPETAWRDERLLGTLLLSSRERLLAPREGRAGRESAPCVYTPPKLARHVLEGLQIGPKRVLDPACGAGAFLLAAFERALQRRLEGRQKPREAARRALSHELAGVDTDAQALALCEFSLRMAAFNATGLEEDAPLDLRRADALGPLPGLEGQFDVVAGNPPYVEGRGLNAKQLAWLRTCYRSAREGKVNLFAVFVERGLTLLKEGGVLSFILPSTFQRNERYRALRELLLEYTLDALEPLPADSFDGRVLEPVLLRVRKSPPGRGSCVRLPGGTAPQGALALGPALRFCQNIPGPLRTRVQSLEKLGTPLGELFDTRDGISTGFQPFPRRLLGRVEGGAFIALDGTKRAFDPKLHVKIIDGGEFSAFSPIKWEGRFIEYDKVHEHHPPHPGKPFNCQLRERAIFDRPEKLLSRQTARGLIATVDRAGYFTRNSVHVTAPKESAWGGSAQPSFGALCACFNSRLYNEYYLAVTGENGTVFPQVHISDLRRLPLVPELLFCGGQLDKLGEALLHPGTSAPERDRARAEVERLLEEAFGI
jgi:SAM-dependent methyltransferase